MNDFDLGWMLDACNDKSKCAQFALLLASAAIGDGVALGRLPTHHRQATEMRILHYKTMVASLEKKLDAV